MLCACGVWVMCVVGWRGAGMGGGGGVVGVAGFVGWGSFMVVVVVEVVEEWCGCGYGCRRWGVWLW